MIVIPIGVKVHLALGPTDMRKGLDRLATLFQGQRKSAMLIEGIDWRQIDNEWTC
jgi:hypothetical protein